MGTVDQKDAPEGYYAVKPMNYLSNGRGSCYACELDGTDCGSIVNTICLGSHRRDGQEVIFKFLEDKEHERDQHERLTIWSYRRETRN